MEDARSLVPRAPWWLFLVTGILWIVFAWIVLRFDNASVAAVSVLAGLVVLFAAASELMMAFLAPGWRWLHALLAVLFAITGIVILFRPGTGFAWLAAFVGWYLLIKGFFDVVTGFATKSENEAWWLSVLVGVVEILLGFWAAGSWVRSAFLLVALVAGVALAHGVADIVLAFRLRGNTSRFTGRGAAAPGPAAP
ncbi:HdeD family acid-resistance protein [Phytohabitans houttuyneae]|jgi:uncharacterized membrane protein HdeD (DUF308 family)|uniref:Membrane protein n=1 Tax=Phytohabitans houttuyneae TaxID=1076126 RepID=A0A6V8K3J0_9ACTN|nr:DUF308 domain-containing protein [Phytohabitans houttuyneae]GFJ76941.1 membrane protein [Phytohabitans houttuyneae]